MATTTTNGDGVMDWTDTPPSQFFSAMLEKKKRAAVLLFWAPWHEATVADGPMDQFFLALAAASLGERHPAETEEANLLFGRVMAEDGTPWTDQYHIAVVPTFLLLTEQGQLFDKIEGGEDVSSVTQAVQRLQQHVLSSNRDDNRPQVPSLVAASSSASSLNSLTERLNRLIRSAPVMIFIKGTPTQPRCGFSRQAVKLLQAESIPFGSFDILTDEEVRQGLKTHSNWPTYPQIYAHGQLVGGLDILKAMKEEEGSLRKQLLGAVGGEGQRRQDTTSSDAPSAAPVPLEERLKQLIHQKRVMLFMKGSPSAPRCGFSRQMVDMLNEEASRHGTSTLYYDTFDILQDEEVRQGLKEFSQWPTYPQLYVDGQLIGGLDIVKEMQTDGSLANTLFPS